MFVFRSSFPQALRKYTIFTSINSEVLALRGNFFFHGCHPLKSMSYPHGSLCSQFGLISGKRCPLSFKNISRGFHLQSSVIMPYLKVKGYSKVSLDTRGLLYNSLLFGSISLKNTVVWRMRIELWSCMKPSFNIKHCTFSTQHRGGARSFVTRCSSWRRTPTQRYSEMSHCFHYGSIINRSLVTAHFFPLRIQTWSKTLKDNIMHSVQWMQRGFKLFGANLNVSILLFKKKIKGKPLTYREHKILVRTTYDLIKLIPFSFFIIIPFAELLLPVALWLFPGMLPSTFATSTADNSYLKRKLKAKQDLAQFFQDLVAERTRQVLEGNPTERSKYKALLLREFQDKLIHKARLQASRTGNPNDANSQLFLSVEETLKYAKVFRDEFKLDKMTTKTLLVLCEMLGLHPYRIRANIILQLRYYILRLQEEDRFILWEGVNNLTAEELRDACRERAMAFYGISVEVMQEQMNEWLKLSSHRDISPLLLLWTRSMTMTYGASQTKLPESKDAGFVKQDSAVSPDDLLPVIAVDSKPSQLNVNDNETETRKKVVQIYEQCAQLDHHLGSLREIAKQLQEDHLTLVKKAAASHDSTAGAEETTPPTEHTLYQLTSVHTKEDTPRSSAGALSIFTLEHLSRNALLERCQHLTKEIHLLHSLSDLQHEQTQLLVRSLTNIIDIYRSSKRQSRLTSSQRQLESFVNYLEKTVGSFEEVISRASGILEEAKQTTGYLKKTSDDVYEKEEQLLDDHVLKLTSH